MDEFDAGLQLVLIGPPGAGKGTIAEKLKARYPALAHLSTGEILREAISAGTDVGREVQDSVEAGRLAPDDVMNRIMAEILGNAGSFVLDGYPRTVPQAEFLADLPGVDIDAVLYVAVPRLEAARRIAGRQECPGGDDDGPEADCGCSGCHDHEDLEPRADDEPETVLKRFDVYMRKTAPVLDYYRGAGLLREIDGTGTREEVWARVEAALTPLLTGSDDNR